uniref:Tumor protein p53-inducible protein 13 n=1 Tax=Oryzias melastigma TaxID=30732 RepID=A0A3B3DB09_ORYME
MFKGFLCLWSPSCNQSTKRSSNHFFLSKMLPSVYLHSCACLFFYLQRLPSIETVYNPEHNFSRNLVITVGKNIIYANRTVLLQHGAAVLLYHPCAQPRERRLLSGLAHSCLPDYILTPHPQLSRLRPIAVVSWGRTLELMSAASLDVCEWLETTNSRREESDGGTQKYDLLLIGPAASHRQQLKTKTISSLLRGAPRVNVRKTRTAIRKRRESDSNTSGKADQNPTNKTLQDSRGGSSSLGSSADSLLALSSSRRGLDSEDIKQTSMRVTPPANSSGLGSFRMAKMEAQKLARSDGSAGKHSADSEQRPNAAILKIMEAAKHKAQKKKLGGPANVNEVKEREVGDKQRLSTTLPHHRSETIRVESVSKSQKHPNLQQVDDSNCGVCEEGKPCASGKRPAAGNRGSPRTPRTDEAVWAAGALGFLLILLTLSVLHTRLYRHWRTTPSLYWHDPQRDYDSVAGGCAGERVTSSHFRFSLPKARVKVKARGPNPAPQILLLLMARCYLTLISYLYNFDKMFFMESKILKVN